MPLQATSGAASYDAFGGGVPVVPTYIEDIFSCFLYTGNDTSQTITNGIDLSTKGGLVWCKGRSAAFYSNVVYDTINGTNKRVATNQTNALITAASSLTAFNTTGFSLGADAGGEVNENAINYVSWTFRKQPKFFDVVTYTGNGAASRNIAHNLGSVPGSIINKALSVSDNWGVYHRSTGANGLYLNATNSAGVTLVPTGHTSTTFEVADGYGLNNSAGVTYVAYLFAHDAGGFGLTGTDNVISCGSVSATGSTLAEVNLGWEPQWLLIKGANINNGWNIIDNMRGFTANNGVAWLIANSSGAEIPISPFNTPGVYLTSTGFKINANESPNNGTGNYIYIAIRRGPMKVPTLGTSVFTPIARTGTGANATVTSVGFPVDLLMSTSRQGFDAESFWDRLRNSGGVGRLLPSSTSAEIAGSEDSLTGLDVMDGFRVGVDTDGRINYSPWTYVYHCFRRAPSFFDEVCYTGTYPTVSTQTHNLGVAPELMIVKNRSGTSQWSVYSLAWLNSLGLRNRFGVLNTTANFFATDSDIWNNTLATSTSFQVNATSTNANGSNFVAYLFATCAGVSKCGLYTGNGSSQTIDCGFTSGARFVLIKKSSGTGDWMVSDSARGIVAGSDPYLELNNTNAEVAGEDWLDTDSTGFVVNEVSGSNANTSDATYIFLAIA